MWSGSSGSSNPTYPNINPSPTGAAVLHHRGEPGIAGQGQPAPPYGYQPPAGVVPGQYYPPTGAPGQYGPPPTGMPGQGYPPATGASGQYYPPATGAPGYYPPVGVPGGYPPVQCGYQPPAGAVGTMTGDEEWITVQHGMPFPSGQRLVQAMDRMLYNNDNTAKESYVALWTKNGEPVFGRAWNKNGKIEAWFPHDGVEHDSGTFSFPSFQLLIYSGPPRQYFRYAWVPMNQLTMNQLCQPVKKGEYSPAVLTGIRVNSLDGEILGKCNLSRRMAWISYGGKEHHFAGDTVDRAYVLCRVPL